MKIAGNYWTLQECWHVWSAGYSTERQKSPAECRRLGHYGVSNLFSSCFHLIFNFLVNAMS